MEVERISFTAEALCRSQQSKRISRGMYLKMPENIYRVIYTFRENVSTEKRREIYNKLTEYGGEYEYQTFQVLPDADFGLDDISHQFYLQFEGTSKIAHLLKHLGVEFEFYYLAQD